MTAGRLNVYSRKKNPKPVQLTAEPVDRSDRLGVKMHGFASYKNFCLYLHNGNISCLHSRFQPYMRQQVTSMTRFPMKLVLL